jgi:phosphoribosyl-AMP cyclohydrolase / phosphoribosyl-ATP pyrophosphohydrolase
VEQIDASKRLIAVVQDRLTGRVLWVGWLDEQTLHAAEDTGSVHLPPGRAEQGLSGEQTASLRVHSVSVNSANQSALLLVSSMPTGVKEQLPFEAAPFLLELERLLQQRQASTGEKSYTRSLLDAGAPRIGDKIMEEGAELAEALRSESDERVLSETGDLLFHTLVGLRLRNLDLWQVIEVLATRFGVSGHAEKAARRG